MDCGEGNEERVEDTLAWLAAENMESALISAVGDVVLVELRVPPGEATGAKEGAGAAVLSPVKECAGVVEWVGTRGVGVKLCTVVIVQRPRDSVLRGV